MGAKKKLIFLSAYPLTDVYTQRFFHLLPFLKGKFEKIIIIDAIASWKEKFRGLLGEPRFFFNKEKFSHVGNVISFRVLPVVPNAIAIRIPYLYRFNGSIIHKLIKDILDENKPFDTIVGTCHPYMYNFLLSNLPSYHTFYDCPDLHEEFPWAHKKQSIKCEKQLIKTVRKCIASSNYIKQVKEKQSGIEFNVVTNGVNYEKFSKAVKVELSRSRIGYVGAIDKWLDFSALNSIATHFPETEIYLVGAIAPEQKNICRELESKNRNVVFAGPKNHDEIPAIIKTFKVGLIPFKVNELIRGVSPIKLFEYFASGVPVVSSYWPELEPYSRNIYFVRDDTQYIDCVRRALNEEQDISSMNEIALTNSWSRKADEYFKLISRTSS